MSTTFELSACAPHPVAYDRHLDYLRSHAVTCKSSEMKNINAIKHEAGTGQMVVRKGTATSAA
jgi:hypothetical protein